MRFSTLLFVATVLSTHTTIAQNIVKGPYLQVGTSSSMIIRWETSLATESDVRYGTAPGTLLFTRKNPGLTTKHEVMLTHLLPGTRYYYSIGTESTVLQGDTNNYFITSPVQGTAGKYRFWVTGDCGNASQNQLDVKNQFLQFNKNRAVDGWLLLGDNAYQSGTDAEYTAKFFGVYQQDIMKHAVLWPAPGNHDYLNGSVTHSIVPYFDLFTTPAAGEAGGAASGNEAYYSFDYGNIHFISLDSYGTTGAAQKMYDTTGAQALWLKQDLAGTNAKWKIAFWHHPPYTMGSHNSDTEGELIAIRENFIRILERSGVDLVLCGHSHLYERSKLMRGHYGFEQSFNPSLHQLSGSSALYDGTANSCPYEKDSLHRRNGIVYVVSGSAGQVGGQQPGYPHNAYYYSNNTNGGSVVLDVEENRLDLLWLCNDGIVRDRFTMVKKSAGKVHVIAQQGEELTLKAGWPGSYQWDFGNTGRIITTTATHNTTYIVADGMNCLSDTFQILVSPVSVTENKIPPLKCSLKSGELSVENSTSTEIHFELLSLNGNPVIRGRALPGISRFPGHLSPGIYILCTADGARRKLGVMDQ